MALIWKHVSENYPDFKWYARFWDDNYVIPSTFEALIPSSFDVSSPLEIERLALANEGGRLVPVSSEALIIRGAAPAGPSQPPHGPESLGHGRPSGWSSWARSGPSRGSMPVDGPGRRRDGAAAQDQGCSNRESRESRGAKKRQFAPNREAIRTILPRTAGREGERATAREAGRAVLRECVGGDANGPAGSAGRLARHGERRLKDKLKDSQLA